MEQPIRITIADDHQVLVDGLRSLLNQEPDLTCVGTTGHGNEVLPLLENTPCEVLLLDLNLPGQDGVEICKKAHARFPELGIIALTMQEGGHYVSEMVKHGARGYLLKNTDRQELLQAIRTVAGGGQHFGAEVTAQLIGAIGGQSQAASSLPKLSRREKEVLQLIVQEHTTQEIADKMFVSVNTVESHRRNLLTKLGARNVAGLVRIAVEHGLV